MTTRRDFLKTGVGAAAGIVFCGCGLLQRANAQQQAVRQTLPVAIGGKRIKTIDVHSHCFFPAAGALLGPLSRGPYIAGDVFTAADISCGYAVGLSRFLGFEERLDPVLRDYAGRVTRRPAYQRAMSKAQPVG